MAKTVLSPGAFLTHMLEKHKLNPFKLSKDIYLSQSAVRLITLGKTRISVSVALRLAKYFNTNPEFWLVMQMRYDLTEANKDKGLMNIVKNISRFTRSPADGKKTAVKKPAKKAVAKKATAKKAAAKRPAAKKKAAVKTARKPARAKARKGR